jgi:hypothetical protein
MVDQADQAAADQIGQGVVGRAGLEPLDKAEAVVLVLASMQVAAQVAALL